MLSFTLNSAKIFGGVPLVDRTLTVDDSKKLVRATEAETADFIMKDLSEAALESNIPDKATLPTTELGRVTKEAVWAMQARVYMYFAKDNHPIMQMHVMQQRKLLIRRAAN